MNRVEVIHRVGVLSLLPNTELATTKQIAEFYGVKSQAINIAIGFNRKELASTGVRQASHKELKDGLFELAGSTKTWIELRTNLGIATSTTNLYPKQAVLLIGFMLEGSEVAEKVRKLVLGDDVDDLFDEPEQEEYAYQMPYVIDSPVIVEPTVQKEQYNMEVVKHDEQLVIDSRDVAEMVGKRHDNVMRDITTIISHLGGQLKIEESYFIESTYINNQNKLQPCFNLTKKGCELFATRMTGAKGTQFAVTYIEKFNQMEEQLKSQVTVASYMIDNAIERAKMWIIEQEQTMLLETTVQEQVVVIEEQAEVIEFKQEVINTLTEGVSI